MVSFKCILKVDSVEFIFFVFFLEPYYLFRAYDQYSFQIIPVLGELIAGEWRAYQYLVESIRNFPNQENFKDLIESAGFRMVSYENLTFGVVAIHSGFKL